MDQTEQINAFASDVEDLIARYRKEFDLTLASAIGVLEIAKLHLYGEQVKKLEGDDNT